MLVGEEPSRITGRRTLRSSMLTEREDVNEGGEENVCFWDCLGHNMVKENVRCVQSAIMDIGKISCHDVRKMQRQEVTQT